MHEEGGGYFRDGGTSFDVRRVDDESQYSKTNASLMEI